jgi:uncharacterized membrane protein YgcG
VIRFRWSCLLLLMRIQRGKIGEFFFVIEVAPRLRQEISTVFGMLIFPHEKCAFRKNGESSWGGGRGGGGGGGGGGVGGGGGGAMSAYE